MLLVGQAPVVVPGLPVLAAASQRRHGEQPAAIHPGQPFWLERRPDRDLATAIAVEQRRDLAVGNDITATGKEERNSRAVIGGDEDLLTHEVIWIPREC